MVETMGTTGTAGTKSGLSLLLQSDQSKSDIVSAELRKRPISIRVKAALKTSMPWLVVAVVGAFVPILHFVIVPLALLAIVYLGVREMTATHVYRVTRLNCPHCETPYGETEFSRLPKRFACFQCRITSTLSAT